MQLDWTTFVLEILNFLVLLWILKRFLYKPVLSAIAGRKADIERTLADAERTRAEAQTLRTQYENRLADWERERVQARAELLEGLGAERGRQMANLQDALRQEREKAAAMDRQRLGELTRQVEEQAIRHGAQFATRLLSRLATPELEAALVELVVKDLAELPEDQTRNFRSAASNISGPIIITSAYPLTTPQRDALRHALHRLIGREIPGEFRKDGALLAGLRISVGMQVLGANLRDELKYFSETVPDASTTRT